MHCKQLAAVVAGLGAMAFPASALAAGRHTPPPTVSRNIAVQSNQQGGQLNVSPQVQVLSGDNGNGLIALGSGNGNNDSQTQANQDQGNVAAQANSGSSSGGSQGAWKEHNDSQPGGSTQQNIAGQSNQQGGQANVSPQVQVLSADNGNGLIAAGSGNGNNDSQSQANQDQGNLALQGNSNGS